MDILEILVRNWPDAHVLHRVHGVTGLSQKFSDEERVELRNAGVAQLVEIDGKVYVPPGQTTAGTPLSATIGANNLMWKLDELRSKGDELVNMLDQAALGKPRGGEWEPLIHDGWCGFRSGDLFVRAFRLP
jgi:hypothetical protein